MFAGTEVGSAGWGVSIVVSIKHLRRGLIDRKRGSPLLIETPGLDTQVTAQRSKGAVMVYGGGILVTILVVLAIIYLAKRI